MEGPDDGFDRLVREGVIRNGEYNTNKNDLIKEFYTPILSVARYYDRTTGSFSASGIKVLARPLVPFLRNALTYDTKTPIMRIVASHDIPERDYDEMAEGYRERLDLTEKGLVSILERMKTSSDEELARAIRHIGTMVGLGLLDIKIALPTNKLRGMYHRKIGIFEDFRLNRISFEGSPNISFHGEGGEENLEGLVAFCSNDLAIDGYKQEHKEFFESLWNNNLENVYVRPLEKYPRELLASYGVPMEVIQEELEIGPKPQIVVPHTCQREAVNDWVKNGRKGIFDMCTGSGKSRAALMAIETITEQPLTVIVCGSLVDLIDQWETKELIPRYTSPKLEVVKISSSHGTGDELRARLRDVVQDFNGGQYARVKKQVFVLAAIQSASQDWFVDMINRVQSNRLAIIIDEVHHAGSSGPTGNVLKINAGYRIGLSATWRRFDDDENLSLEGYFRGKESAVAYRYPLAFGIRDGLLSKYRYYIHHLTLEATDADDFRERLAKYEKTLKEIDPSLNMRLGELELRRLSPTKWKKVRELRNGYRDALGRAMAKTDVAFSVVKGSYRSLKKCIVYCATKAHLERTAILMGEDGWDLSPYDSDVSKEDRQSIRQKFSLPYQGRPIFIGAIHCLDEGIDLPALDSAILVSSNKTEREWIQRRGRILRRSAGKEYSIIHDIFMAPQPSRTLSEAEMDYVSAELTRIEAFGDDSENRDEVHATINSLRNLYGL